MADERKEKKSITHYLGIGVAVATILSAIGGYVFIFIIFFSSKGRTWTVLEKGIESAKIAVVSLRGIISDPGSQTSLAHIEIVRNALKDIESDGNVKAVVFRINSPGGEGTYTDRIYDMIVRFKQKNPSIKFFSFIESMAASGGYYLACVSDYIMAEPESIVGSIGVFFGKLNIEKLLDKIGIRFEIVKSSHKKDFGAFWRTMSEDEKEMINKIILSFHERFLDIILKCRKKLNRSDLKILADGSIFTGRESVNNGLVDEIGYFADILEVVKKSINVNNPKVSEYSPKKTIFEELFGRKMNIYTIEQSIFHYSATVWLLWEGYILR